MLCIYRNDQYKEVMSDVLMASRAQSTVSKYARAFATWESWCKNQGVSHKPASSNDVARYFINLHLGNSPYSTIETAFYSIKWFHDCDPGTLRNPCEAKFLKCLLEGLKRIHDKPVSKKEPVTVDMLEKIVSKFGESNNLMDIRLCAICLLSYAGFLRNSELLNIKECDVEFNTSFVSIFLSQSKTDQYREGAWVVIAETGSKTCPVSMLKRYMQLANSEGSDKFLFRPLVFCKSSNQHKLKNGQMTYSRCREIFKEALTKIGVDAKDFGLHSLRAGGATAAAQLGVPDRLFKKHGRWRSEGAKDGYVKEYVQDMLTVSKGLGL